MKQLKKKKTEEKETQASEEPEEAKIKISQRNLNKISRYDIYPDDDIQIKMNKRDFKKILENNRDLVEKYEITLDEFTGEVKVKNKPITFSYEKSDMDKNLINEESDVLLKSYNLKLPSYYKDKSMKEIEEAFRKSHEILIAYKDALKNTAKYDTKSDPGKAKAVAKSLDPIAKTRDLIREHNIMEDYNYNLNLLRTYKEKTGTGIIHFNNPLQLLDRLELLIGSLLAGNNGVIQEFSQIAHLLHQLKVITKKQLNDLLKKIYIE